MNEMGSVCPEPVCSVHFSALSPVDEISSLCAVETQETEKSIPEDAANHTMVRVNNTGDQEHAQDGHEQMTAEMDEIEQLIEEPNKPAPTPPNEIEISHLYDRLRELESRVGGIEKNRRGSTSSVASSYAEHNADGDEDGDKAGARRMIAGVRKCNWEQFKNHFGADDDDYAVETLVAGDKLKDEIAWEQRRRFLAETRIKESSNKKIENAPPRQRERLDKAWAEISQNLESKDESDKRWLQRIRINSVPVLKRLGSAAGEAWSSQSRTFFRPFRVLIHYQDKMKLELEALESKHGESHKILDIPIIEGPVSRTLSRVEDDALNDIGKTGTSLTEQGVGRNEVQHPLIEGGLKAQKIAVHRTKTLPIDYPDGPGNVEELELDQSLDSWEALQELRCYVNFVETELIPLYHQFDELECNDSHMIRFDDLWYLFRLGEHIYVPNPKNAKNGTHSGNNDSSKKQSAGRQTTWRLTSMWPPEVIYKIPRLETDKEGNPLVPEPAAEPVAEEDRRFSKIWCYYIDFDGDAYGPILKDFTISYFDGEKSIKELEVYPLRFATDRESMTAEGQTYGRNFVQYLSERPLAYNGWTPIINPEGDGTFNSNGDEIKYPEHIDSDVIVDFKEAFQTYPPWRPIFDHRLPSVAQILTSRDDFFVIRWSDSKRRDILTKKTELVVRDDEIDIIERDVKLKNDPYFDIGGCSRILSEDQDYPLLPHRLFAYALRERRFIHVDIQFLKPIVEHLDGFKSLRIDENHKRMVQSLVSFHFKKKEVEKQGRQVKSQDLVRGKGRGLVILLHGVPGVGKTATAEAVAQAYKKPLFPITSGDLGFTAESVETSLNEIFRLSYLWDCVLLLDEADIFLSQRTKDDLKRNALVSVFLRILEYFNGILFLTTNRPGTLDEAVKSRVHVSLYYGPLGERETEEIFRLNLDRLKEIENQHAEASGEEKLFIFDNDILNFAKQHYRKHINGPGAWNGRQIRNAFQIAASLAHYEGDINPGAQKQLGARHFETVDDATTKYDQYRAEIYGKLEDELAHEREERSDSFQRVGRERGGQMKTSTYGDERQYMSHSSRVFTDEHVPSSQFRTPSPMAGYSGATPAQASGPPPLMVKGVQYQPTQPPHPSRPPQTPPAQIVGLPQTYHDIHQQDRVWQGTHTSGGYQTPGQQFQPRLQRNYGISPAQVAQEPGPYLQTTPVSSQDPRYGAAAQGLEEYADRGPSPLGGAPHPATIPSYGGMPQHIPARDNYL